MTRRGIIAWLSLAALCVLPGHSAAPVPIRFEPLTRADGISPQSVEQILQDHRGFLWYTCGNRLTRYDGLESVSFSGFPTDPGGPGVNAGVLYEDRTGTLWVGTAVLSTFNPGSGATTRFVPPHHGPANALPAKITAIHDDAGGFLWLGATILHFPTEKGEPVLYRFDPATGASKAYAVPSRITLGRPGGIHAIEIDKAGRLWLGTTYGMVAFEPTTGEFVHYPHTHDEPEIWPLRTFNSFAWDQTGMLWVHMPAGLERFDPRTGAFDRFREAKFWHMSADGSGRLWLFGGYQGLKVFDPQSDTFTLPERYSDGVSSTLADEIVTALTPDREGNVWAYFTRGGGLHRFSPFRARFGKFLPDPGNTNSLSGGRVWQFSEDSDGSIWIATADSGLNRFDPASGRFTRFRHIPGDPRSLASDKIGAMHLDRDGTLWIGSADGIGKFDRKTGRYQHLRDRFARRTISLLFVDRTGRFWVGDWMGPMNLVDRQTGAVTPMQVIGGYAVHEDRNGNLWFGAMPESLNKLEVTGNIRKISLARSADGGTLTGTSAVAFYEDSAGILWIATRAGLFRFDPNTEKSIRYTVQDGLATEDIQCVLPDELGNLWLSTSLGISRFNQQQKRFYNYDERDGLQGATFTPGACYQARDGRLYFGGNTGFNAFYPREVLAGLPQPLATISDFKVSGRKALALPHPIWETNALSLSPDQNSFSFEFTELSYASPWKTRYRFRLEGMERDWTEVDSGRRTARYTGLAPGGYIFRVQASADGITWEPQGASLRLAIAAPWWKTWWSYGAGFLVFAGLILGGYSLRVNALYARERRLQAIVAERTSELVVARDQAQAANRAKSAFLANMSHELRTPLHAILGFSHLLRENCVSEEQLKADVDVINDSGEHLLYLIDSVLDMAKLEVARKIPAIAPCDLNRLLRSVVDMFRVRAGEKRLDLLLYISPDAPQYVRTDASYLRQIMINLLSNAIKYTERGAVTLHLTAAPLRNEECLLTLDVEDTGRGIAAEDQARIFEAFVRVGDPAQKGAGLGLAITRQLVELIGGTVGVESTPGKGSRFRVEMPVALAMESEVVAPRVEEGRVTGLEPGQPEYRILVCDDEPTNSMVLHRLLQKVGFAVRVTADGAQAIDVFRAWRPHFIMTDLRMPVLDGFETARQIRKLEGGSEVKIAVVTASAFSEQTGDLLAAGFDDFIRKPFRFSEVFDCMSRQLGVRYVRSEARPESPGAPEALRPEDFAALPADVRKDLADALTSLDREQIETVIQRVSQKDVRLGNILQRHAERLAYTAMLTAVKRCEPSVV